MLGQVTRERATFTLATAASLGACTWVCWLMYGQDFLWHANLYHLTRTDNRHNFSAWFYPMYLAYDAPATRRLLGLVAFLPQVAVLGALSLALGPVDPPLCLALQTLVFVGFNKVVTAQYFCWYLSIFPAAGPSLPAMVDRGEGGQGRGARKRWAVALGLLWLAALLGWLWSAYLLEFQGVNTFTQTWVASLVFLGCNTAVAAALIRGAPPYKAKRE
jgi:phosphatidylinositol glycan class M